MNEFAICDYFKWTLNDVRNLTIKEFMGMQRYLNKVRSDQKKAESKVRSKTWR